MFDAIKNVMYLVLIRVTHQLPLEFRELKRGHATNRGERNTLGTTVSDKNYPTENLDLLTCG
jgi:hypothetical protein